jgi:hypothetical protein
MVFARHFVALLGELTSIPINMQNSSVTSFPGVSKVAGRPARGPKKFMLGARGDFLNSVPLSTISYHSARTSHENEKPSHRGTCAIHFPPPSGHCAVFVRDERSEAMKVAAAIRDDEPKRYRSLAAVSRTTPGL